MGQRHQIYLRLPGIYYNDKNPNNRDEVTVGMHNQWLYGYSAAASLYRFLKYADLVKGDQYSPLVKSDPQEALEVLDHAYSLDIETGYSSRNSQFPIDPKHKYYEECCKDPRLGDNNNGITVIDLADVNSPKYCFMSIGHLECLHETKDRDPDSDEPAYVNFYPISINQWAALHYGDEWRSEAAKAPGAELLLKRVDFVDKKFKVLTTKRLIEIFPALKADLLKGAKDKEKLEPSSVKLMRELGMTKPASKKRKK